MNDRFFCSWGGWKSSSGLSEASLRGLPVLNAGAGDGDGICPCNVGLNASLELGAAVFHPLGSVRLILSPRLQFFPLPDEVTARSLPGDGESTCDLLVCGSGILVAALLGDKDGILSFSNILSFLGCLLAGTASGGSGNAILLLKPCTLASRWGARARRL